MNIFQQRHYFDSHVITKYNHDQWNSQLRYQQRSEYTGQALSAISREPDLPGHSTAWSDILPFIYYTFRPPKYKALIIENNGIHFLFIFRKTNYQKFLLYSINRQK